MRSKPLENALPSASPATASSIPSPGTASTCSSSTTTKGAASSTPGSWATRGAPILDFTWEGQRLVKVTGRDGSSSGAVVYTRQLNYSGDHLTSESITFEGKGSKIEYKYDKQGRLVEADCDADHSLDGRSRKVYFLTEEK